MANQIVCCGYLECWRKLPSSVFMNHYEHILMAQWRQQCKFNGLNDIKNLIE